MSHLPVYSNGTLSGPETRSGRHTQKGTDHDHLRDDIAGKGFDRDTDRRGGCRIDRRRQQPHRDARALLPRFGESISNRCFEHPVGVQRCDQRPAQRQITGPIGQMPIHTGEYRIWPPGAETIQCQYETGYRVCQRVEAGQWWQWN
jgi:hypothetical protein